MKVILSVVAVFFMMTGFSADAEAARCKVELKNGRGRILEVFRGHGYDRREACQEAKRDCRRVVRSGYYRARYQTCEVLGRGGNGGRMVQKSCQAHMIGPRGGRILQRFLGQARGVRGTGVKAQACQRALRQCRRARENSGRYRAICRAENGRGGYNTPTRPRYPRRNF